MTTLFLFAHQDDEMGVFDEITRTLARGAELYCLYLTNGAWDGVTPEKRNAESLKVLANFGVMPDHIIFLGERLGIHDGRLVEHLELCYDGLRETAEQISAKTGKIERLIMHAFEGGHQDHDAVYVLGTALAKELDCVQNSFQFPLYRMPAGRILMTHAKPLEQNGAAHLQTISWGQRINHLAQMRHYQSQRRVMLKIGFHMALSYLRDGTAKLQPIRLERVKERPHSGQLLYEYWTLYTYEAFQDHTTPFIQHTIDDLSLDEK